MCNSKTNHTVRKNKNVNHTKADHQTLEPLMNPKTRNQLLTSKFILQQTKGKNDEIAAEVKSENPT